MAHKWSKLRDEIMADPVRRARIAGIGRAMNDATAVGAWLDSTERIAGTYGNTSRCDTASASIELEDNLYLSTLADGIEMLGGRLEVRAVFPDETVLLVPRTTGEDNEAPHARAGEGPVAAVTSGSDDDPTAPAST
jgi:hypothetical protein